ncbi:hypothetical protein ACWGIE_19975 [Pseudomonas fulva]
MSDGKPKQLCVLCGERAATGGHGDHLPPQCIYPKPRPSNIAWNKVPACIPCNNAGSKDDEQFKLIIGISTGEFREDTQPVIDGLAGTIRNNKRLANQVLGKYKRGYGKRHGNRVLEPVVAIPFDRDAYERVVQRIVRGLYWQQSGVILHRDAEIHVVAPEPMEAGLGDQIKTLLRHSSRVELNGGTFVYKVFISDDGNSFWGLQFFEKHLVFAFVYPPEEDSQPAGLDSSLIEVKPRIVGET